MPRDGSQRRRQEERAEGDSGGGLLKLAAYVLVAILLLSPLAVLAQEENVHIVPEEGYSGTDTFQWRDYLVEVKRGYNLIYEFDVVGDGLISVYLSPQSNPFNYYDEYSTVAPAASFNITVPAYYGSDLDYIITVNSSTNSTVQCAARIYTEKAPTTHYYVYYALIAIGFVVLVWFSWKFVVWQDKKEREKKKEDRRKDKGGHRKRGRG